MMSPHSTRSLLVEQLESRCLLAGGLFFFSHAEDRVAAEPSSNPLQHASSPNDRPAELRTLGREGLSREGLEHRGFDSTPQLGQRGERSSEPHSRRDDRPNPPNDQPPTSALPQRSVLTVIITASARTPSSTGDSSTGSVGNGSSGTEPPFRTVPSSLGSGGNASRPIVVDFQPSSADSDPLVDGAAFVRADANVPQLSEPRSQSLAASTSTSHDANVAKRDSNEELPVRDTQPDIEQDSTTTDWIYDSVSMGAEEPFVDFLPLRRQAPFAEAPIDPVPEWELGDDTLRRLKEVVEPADEGATVPHDAIAAAWFNGPEGLIELTNNGTPLIRADIIDQLVAVKLDASLGLHRSLDLLAVTESQPSDDDIRVAILNAIARVGSAPSPPINEDTAARVSALTYPGIALVAGSLAVAAHRRRAIKRAVDAESLGTCDG